MTTLFLKEPFAAAFGKKNTLNDSTVSFWLVVSTPFKRISQIGNLPQIGVKIKHILNHHLAFWDTKPFPQYVWWFLSSIIWASLTGCGSGPLPHLCLALMRFTIKSLGFITMMVKIPITSYITPWKFNSSPLKILKIYHPKTYSNHHFSRGELFNFRGVRLPKGGPTKGKGLFDLGNSYILFRGTLGNLQESW